MPENQKRGGHAHRTDIQLIVCLQGKAKVRLESTQDEEFTVRLESAHQGLIIPPMWWGEMEFSHQAVLLGMASEVFDEEDYIRDKADFQ